MSKQNQSQQVKTKVSEIYDLWLRLDDLKKPETVVTISGVEYRTLYPAGRPKEALVLSFRGATRKLALSQSQASSMVDLFGEDFYSWAGERILLRKGKALNGKDTILIEKAPAERQAQRPQQAQPPQEVLQPEQAGAGA